jgi:Fic family protein
VQFETIHPILDGNGRLGRLLITLILCAKGILREPLLYLSLYFKTHRQRYYDLLQRVQTEGIWEEWTKFFLEGTQITARQAADTAVQFSVYSRQTEKRSARWAGRLHQAWPSTSICRHIR